MHFRITGNRRETCGDPTMAIIAQILLALMPLLAVPGWDCREGWELIALWGAAAAYSLLLTSWWRRAFLWLGLFQLILHPAGISYAGFAMIAVFLGTVEVFKRIDTGRIMQCMAIGSGSLGALMVLQLAGVMPIYSPYGHAAGFFNPGSAGVYLALCLPAFVHVWWAAGICLGLIAVTHSTTAMVTGAAVVGLSLALKTRGQRSEVRGRKKTKNWVATIAAGVLLALMLWKLDPIGRTLNQDPRWELWRQTLQTYQSAPLGRGIGSYQQIMPYFISGNPRLVKTRNAGAVGGKPVLTQDIWWNYAHNEFLQAGFELGMQGMILALAWVIWVGFETVNHRAETQIYRASEVRAAEPQRSATDTKLLAGIGIMALAIASLGWFPLHVAPLALTGMAWIGIWERRKAKVGDQRSEVSHTIKNRDVGGRFYHGAGVWP